MVIKAWRERVDVLSKAVADIKCTVTLGGALSKRAGGKFSVREGQEGWPAKTPAVKPLDEGRKGPVH